MYKQSHTHHRATRYQNLYSGPGIANIKRKIK